MSAGAGGGAFVGATLAEMRDALAAGAVNAAALAEAHNAAAEAAAPLNAWINTTPAAACAAAADSDARRSRGEAGVLDGIPVAVKDLFCTAGVATTAASRILDGFVPSYESGVTARLFKAGALPCGKANLDEFAMGSSTVTSHYGVTHNPWRRRGDTRPLVPGGSSGGSAALVAARAVPLALGTDTGGSIRQPAAFCGVVGLKPTYGRCSRWGIIAFASSLDQAGPLTRTVRDAAIALTAMAGHDPRDSTSVNRAVPDYEAALTGDIRGLTVGVPGEYRLDGMAGEIDALWERGVDWLREAGAQVRPISLPFTRYALPAYYIIAPAEASSNLARYDGVRYGLRVAGDDLIDQYERTRGEGFGAEVRRRVMIGSYVLSAGYYDAYYLRAQRVRRLIAQDFSRAFENVDLVLTPTCPFPAFPVGERMDDPVAMYLNDVFTVPSSLAGLPALSVPAGLSADGLPLGLQLIGRPFDEETVLCAGAVLEDAAAFDAVPAFTVDGGA